MTMITTADYKEKAFENDIVKGFADQGWLTASDDTGYDPVTGLYVPDVMGWLESAYPDKYKQFTNAPAYKEKILAEIESTLNKKGTLWLLRNEIAVIGFCKFKMCELKPADPRNKDINRRYGLTRLRVVQQVHFRPKKKDSIDLVYFINGIPVATAEVKTNFTQDVNQAVEQYRKNRLPKPKNAAESPLLRSGRGAIVHFAVSENDIQMTTKLQGESTKFLPFNQGVNGGAGNPDPTLENPYPVSYFWKEIGQKDAWIDLFQRFVFVETKTVITEIGTSEVRKSLIFPRYHQWRAVTKMIADAKKRGVGQKYLIEHSAGSGKTKTITWTAFQLASLVDKLGKPYFDTVLVMSDRKVLDKQLSDAITQFNNKEWLVQSITNKDGSKTNALVEALVNGKRIVVVTIQTFPFAMEQIILNQDLAGKHFAVIFDEAHNSQTGKSSARLNAALGSSGKGQDEIETIDDLLEKLQKSRKRPDNVSFFGFTATPKHQTFMLFGRKPDGSPFDITEVDPTKADKTQFLPVSFDRYPMRQAIEEGFIRDVLEGYMPYETSLHLCQKTKEDEESVERYDVKATRRALAKWINLHPTAVSQKVEFIIEHFRRNVAGMLSGNAKAMIVTSSRAAVVRYQKAFEDYIKKHPGVDVPILRIGVPLAAFSGEVLGSDAIHEEDTSTGEDMAWIDLIKPDVKYNEHNLNPTVDFGQDGALERALDSSGYRLMVVANKFQTGFDQPKLCAMYIDKVIANPVEIVQTFSRLNRTYAGKDKTFIIDFANDEKTVLDAFKLYDHGAQITDVQDPQVLEKLRQSILEPGIFNMNHVEEFIKAYYAPQIANIQEVKAIETDHSALNALMGPIAQKYKNLLNHAFENCQDLEQEHRNALQAKNQARADAIDKQLKEALEEYEGLKKFKRNLHTFVHTYGYIAQVTDINEGSLEGLVTYCALLSKYLNGPDLQSVDLSSVMMTSYSIHAMDGQVEVEDEDKKHALRPITGASSNKPHAKLPEHLRDLLNEINSFRGEVPMQDALNYCCSVAGKVGVNKVARSQIMHNPFDIAKQGELGSETDNAVFELLQQHKAFASVVAKNPAKREQLQHIVYLMLHSGGEIPKDAVKTYEEEFNNEVKNG